MPTAEPDIYGLLVGDDLTAEQQARLMSGRIRGRQGLGDLAALTGDPLLSRFGQGLAQHSAADQGLLANALGERAQRNFQTRHEREPAGELLRQIGTRFGISLPADTPERRATQALDYAEKAYAAEQRARELNLNREAMKLTRADAAADRDQKELDRQVEKLSTRLESAPALRSDLETLRKAAAQKDIPGIGSIEGRLPTILLKDDATKVRQAVKGIVGTLIKERSGTAASDKEVERIMDELGMGSSATEDQFRTGLQRLSTQSQDVMRAKEAGARPEAVKEARRRGLVTSEDIPVGPIQSQTPSTDVKARIADLKAQGMSPAQIRQQLRQEGFK